jgi:hypothetical protein
VGPSNILFQKLQSLHQRVFCFPHSSFCKSHGSTKHTLNPSPTRIEPRWAGWTPPGLATDSFACNSVYNITITQVIAAQLTSIEGKNAFDTITIYVTYLHFRNLFLPFIISHYHLQPTIKRITLESHESFASIFKWCHYLTRFFCIYFVMIFEK